MSSCVVSISLTHPLPPFSSPNRSALVRSPYSGGVLELTCATRRRKCVRRAPRSRTSARPVFSVSGRLMQHMLTVVHKIECCGFESHPRQLIFLRKGDCLGCAVLLCFVVCLVLLASSSFLLSSASLIKTYLSLSFLGSFSHNITLV